MPNLAVPVSGTGSILDAMIKAGLPISLVFADRECRGLQIAREANITNVLLSRTFGKSFNRHEYTLGIIKLLEAYKIDLVAMAGFMTVFHPVIFEKYENRIINIHPSLLPSFQGDHAVKDALEAGVKVTGTTIHFATTILDQGPIITQEAVLVFEGDTVETLHERIKIVERRLYPEIVRKLLAEIS